MSKLTRLVWLTAALGLTACDGFGVEGNGRRQDETRETAAFSRVRSSSELDVRIRQGDAQSLTVSLDSNLIHLVKTRVVDDALFIDLDENVRDVVDGPHVLITLPQLSAAKLTGSGDMSIALDQPELPLDLYLDGSGDLSFSGTSAALGAYLNGSGDVRLDGDTGDLDLKLDGSGDVRATELRAESASIELCGSGDASVTVSESVVVSLSGSGDVNLYGGAHLDGYHHDGSGDLVQH
jgi:hypothetical protein